MVKTNGELYLEMFIEKLSEVLIDVVVKGGLTEKDIIGGWFGVEAQGLRGDQQVEEWMNFLEECLAVIEDQYFDDQQSLYEEVMKTLDVCAFV